MKYAADFIVIYFIVVMLSAIGRFKWLIRYKAQIPYYMPWSVMDLTF